MHDLARFQSGFAQAIRQRADGPRSPLHVYRNTSLNGLVEALADNFPVVAELLGDALFGALALGFAEARPPVSPILALYGADFPGWLAEQPVAREISYLADVARCERAHGEAMFAADAPVLTIAAVAALAPEALPAARFTLHPAARFGWQVTSAIDIWLAHRRPVEEEIVIDWRATGYLFTRPALDCLARPIGRAEHRLLARLSLGETLACAAAAALAADPAADIGALFAALVEAGALTIPPARS